MLFMSCCVFGLRLHRIMIVVRVTVGSFDGLYSFFAGILTDFKKNLCDMTEDMAVNRAAKAEPVIVRCCLDFARKGI